MKPRRRLALLAAAVAAAVAVGLARDDDVPPPRDDLHEHYRVQLDLPPVEAALWFAARFPEYFTSGEAGLGPWLDGLDPRDRDFVIAMGQTLAWAWIEHEIAGFQADDPNGLAREATIVIRHQTLNQLDLNVAHYPDVDAIEFNAVISDPQFAAGVFARLVRGVSNCEGQNHLVMLLLDTALKPKGIRAVIASISDGHDLVQLRGSGLVQPIYVDAWSNLPAFTLDPTLPRDAPVLAEIGEPPPPVVPGVAGRAPLSRLDYAESIPSVVALLSDRHAPTQPVDLEIRAPALDEAGLARVKDPWKLYLFARILHVYDDPRAADLYRAVLDRHCSDWPRTPRFVCAASTALLERL